MVGDHDLNTFLVRADPVEQRAAVLQPGMTVRLDNRPALSGGDGPPVEPGSARSPRKSDVIALPDDDHRMLDQTCACRRQESECKYNENRGFRHKTAMTAGYNYYLFQLLTWQIRYSADQWNFSRRSTNCGPLTTE